MLVFQSIVQESLCGRFLKMNDAMKLAARIINLIRGGNRAHRHRKFMLFLEELDSDVRWLSAGKCLKQFFSLRKETAVFLKEEIPDADDSVTLQAQLENDDFLCALAFLTDITCRLNTLICNCRAVIKMLLCLLEKAGTLPHAYETMT